MSAHAEPARRQGAGEASASVAGRRLVVAANRGPVSFHSDPSGEPVVTRGPGGLVSVLTQMLRAYPGTWVAAAQGEEEERLAAAGRSVDVTLEGVVYRVRYVAPDHETYHRYYNIVANPMLWFIQHYLWDLGRHPDISINEITAWRTGYVPVNRMFAEAIVDELGRGGDADGTAAPAQLVFLHDYQLYLVAPDVRAAAPQAFLQQFVHIPWPQSDYWRVLPEELRTAIFRGLLGNDIVAFHTGHCVANFLTGCADLLDASGRPRREGRAARRPQGVGARLPGLHRPRRVARRRPGEPACARRRGSCSLAGAAICCCASTASTPPRT